ncbi:MAG: excinuclease ABC subunit C [Thaumarchaeota archaeon]|nr:excinuclease ABC subunit C [Candidatus Nitrosotalea sp.]MDE1813250.1 excinuclease ABC subunit C [Nitrososphaerota archaeon]MDE1838399.1 excinuclease ABC subunit C [Nitrososphaerota archaeon]
MPLFKKWSSFKKDNVLMETDAYGIYELADRDGKIIYIGQGRISSRLNSHFLNNNHPIPKASYYRAEVAGSKERAEQRERSEIRAHKRSHGYCPSYNMRLG